MPRDHWLEDWEKRAIVDFKQQNPTEGCRKLAFMMLDDDVVAVGPTTVYRVLKQQGRLRPASPPNPRKGKGFHQPGRPHRDWHTDISYLNIAGTFYFLISVIEGYSRCVLHWEIREKMTKTDAEIVVQRALEKYPGEHPRIITDNGSQYTSREFKQFIRLMGMTHIRTSPYYPQSNGKQERWHGTLKQECIRPNVPLSLEDARRLVAQYVTYYNHVRLHSAIGYVAPADRLFGLDPVIHAERDRKLEAARERRRLSRQAARSSSVDEAFAPTASNGVASSLAAIDFQRLRERISIEQVLRHLDCWEELRGTPPQLRGPCPIHDDGERRHDSFSVHVRKNIFRCFHAECGASGNVLDLWAAVRRLPLPEAARDLAVTFNLDVAELALSPRRMGIREEEPVPPLSSPLESALRFATISEAASPH